MKNSKKTIKAQALNFIADSDKPTKRSAVIDFIKSINGTKCESKSYYGDAFQSWEREGLITIKSGIFLHHQVREGISEESRCTARKESQRAHQARKGCAELLS
jgi:hypothetical protein